MKNALFIQTFYVYSHTCQQKGTFLIQRLNSNKWNVRFLFWLIYFWYVLGITKLCCVMSYLLMFMLSSRWSLNHSYDNSNFNDIDSYNFTIKQLKSKSAFNGKYFIVVITLCIESKFFPVLKNREKIYHGVCTFNFTCCVSTWY